LGKGAGDHSNSRAAWRQFDVTSLLCRAISKPPHLTPTITHVSLCNSIMNLSKLPTPSLWRDQGKELAAPWGDDQLLATLESISVLLCCLRSGVTIGHLSSSYLVRYPTVLL
jgi:hypothetical protein